MNIPSIKEAEKLLVQAEQLNKGPWIGHNQTAGQCAKAIAQRCTDLDADTAYVLGLLHDIGRRFGDMDMRHIWQGYTFMKELGYIDSAQICLTHSFPYKDIRAYNGKNDCSEQESQFIQRFLDNTEYSYYDKLIQLCDALSYPTGACIIEKRLVDVVMRRGFNELTIPKWKTFFQLKEYFDKKANVDIYTLLPITI